MCSNLFICFVILNIYLCYLSWLLTIIALTLAKPVILNIYFSYLLFKNFTLEYLELETIPV